MELSHCVSKRARKQLEAELDDYHDEIVGVKENHKLELEQKVKSKETIGGRTVVGHRGEGGGGGSAPSLQSHAYNNIIML